MRRSGSFPRPGPSVSLREVLARETRSLLDETGRAAAAVARRGMTFRDWVEMVPEPHGPLDFRRFPWQVEMYDEHMAHADEAVVMKCTQVGVSALMIRWSLYHADVFGRVCLYTFPTERHLNDFSRERIRPLIRGSHLRDRIAADAVDTVGQRQVGSAGGWLYSRGTNKPIDSIAADCVCFDEFDQSDQANIEASERRVSGPLSAGLLRRVGVPSFPGFGIASAYEASDQRVWSVRCEACGDWAHLRGYAAFVTNLDQERLELVCGRCRRPLNVLSGEWVATHPDRPVRGYHLNRLLLPGQRMLRILVANSQKTRPDQVEAFHTRDLGEPFASSENRLGLEHLRQCVDPDAHLLPALTSARFVAMGVDVASARGLNLVIAERLDDGRTRRVFVGEIDDRNGIPAFDQLDDLMRRYGVGMAVIDHLPEGRLAEQFCARWPGQAYRVHYFSPAPGPRRQSEPWVIDDMAASIGIWRYQWIDRTLDQFRHANVVLPPLDELPPEYPAHLGSLVRRTAETANGNIRIEHVRTGPDDFAHSEVYLFAAFALLWRRAGLQMIAEQEQQLVALDAGGNDDDVDLTSYGGVHVYRSAFSDDY